MHEHNVHRNYKRPRNNVLDNYSYACVRQQTDVTANRELNNLFNWSFQLYL